MENAKSRLETRPIPGKGKALYQHQLFWVLVLACLTLGLAPFRPEPHLVGKLRWVLGGATGMTPTDWGDLLLHGAPWLGLLIYSLGYISRHRTN